MESDEEEEEGPCEWIGVLRLPLKAGSKSGYVGVQRTNSKKRPWQATITCPGKKRRTVGSFKKPEEAAAARAEAKASGANLLPSPRKQAPRNSGLERCACPHDLSSPASIPFSCSHARLMLRLEGKQSMALTPLTLLGANANYSSMAEPSSTPLSAAAASTASAAVDPTALAAACGVPQTARPLVTTPRPAFASGPGSFWAGLAGPVSQLMQMRSGPGLAIHTRERAIERATYR